MKVRDILVILLIFNALVIVAPSVARQKSDNAFGFEFGGWNFRPQMHSLQRYLQARGVEPLEAGDLYFVNLNYYFYDGNQKKGRISFPFAVWKAESKDPRNKVKLRWYEILLAIELDYFFLREHRVNPFTGATFGLYGTGLDINERDLSTIGYDLSFSGGLELDVVKKWFYVRLEGGYKFRVPLSNFTKEITVDVKHYRDLHGDLTVYYVTTVDELDMNDEVFGPFFGASIGVNFPEF